MAIAPTPTNEAERLDALRSLQVLDTGPELLFDHAVRDAAALTGAQIAVVSLIDADRQWFKAKVGLDAAETCRSQAFCAHAILDDAPLYAPDATRDARFSDNPLVTGPPHIRGYAGFPLILQSGLRVGTLCVCFTAPLEPPFVLNESQSDRLLALARDVSAELDARALACRERVCQHDLVTAISNAPTPMAAVDRNHDVLAVNEAARSVLKVIPNDWLASFSLAAVVDDVLCAERERLVSDDAGRTWRARPWRNALGVCEGVVIDLWDDAVALAG